MGCGTTCGCPFVLQQLHLVEPIVHMAEALDAQHMVAADFDFDQWLSIEFYRSEKNLAKAEAEENQKMMAALMGNPDKIVNSKRKNRGK